MNKNNQTKTVKYSKPTKEQSNKYNTEVRTRMKNMRGTEEFFEHLAAVMIKAAHNHFTQKPQHIKIKAGP